MGKEREECFVEGQDTSTSIGCRNTNVRHFWRHPNEFRVKFNCSFHTEILNLEIFVYFFSIDLIDKRHREKKRKRKANQRNSEIFGHIEWNCFREVKNERQRTKRKHWQWRRNTDFIHYFFAFVCYWLSCQLQCTIEFLFASISNSIWINVQFLQNETKERNIWMATNRRNKSNCLCSTNCDRIWNGFCFILPTPNATELEIVGAIWRFLLLQRRDNGRRTTMTTTSNRQQIGTKSIYYFALSKMIAWTWADGKEMEWERTKEKQ